MTAPPAESTAQEADAPRDVKITRELVLSTALESSTATEPTLFDTPPRPRA